MTPHPRRWWEWLAEPRTITILQAMVYTVLLYAGWVDWVDQPEMSVRVAGPFVTDVWGWLLMTSCLFAFLGCLPGIWWLERAGVLGISTACVMQLFIIAQGYLDGGALAIHAAFVLAVALLMAVRWNRISRGDLDPFRVPRCKRT